jgi:dolichol-phosphate mannosyltransferase/undecaprenyl-phosphate 4-deoxy-4-formamido-L-arabinose transferase
MDQTPDISIIIPVYNSDQSLHELTERCKTVLDPLCICYELIFVDDGSSNPESWPTLEKIASQEKQRVSVVQLSTNFGQQAATLCGLGMAKGRYAITMDDDLQHAPEDIPQLWAKRAHDIVIGTIEHKHHAGWRNLCSKFKGYFDYKLVGKPKHITLSPYRMISRLVIDGILAQTSIYPFIPAMMFSVSSDVINVPVNHAPRKYGASTYTLRKMIGMFANLMINNSSYLLHLIGRVGLAAFCLTGAMGIYILFRKLIWDISATGWTSLFLAIAFLGGLNLLAVSVIGEYLVRIIRTIENKPRFCIRQRLEHQ